MAVNQLQIPTYAAPASIDLQTPLAQLGLAYQRGQQRQALSDLGRGLADGTVDYRAAAAKAADMGDIDSSMKFLALDEQRRKEGLQLASANAFNQSLSSMFSGAGQPASPAITGPRPSIPPVQPDASVGVPQVSAPDPTLRAPVASSPTVWGDDEGVRSGLYDPPRTRVAQAAPTPAVSAGSGPAVSPAAPQPQAVRPTPQAAPTAPPAAPAAGFQGIGIQHVPQLMQAISNPHLPAPQKDLANKLLTHALDSAKSSDKVKTLNELKASSGYQGSILELEKELRAASKTEVNVTNKGETKFEEGMGTGQAKRFNEMIEAGTAAQRKLVDINTMREISGRLGSQGAAAGVKEAIGPYAEVLGINIEGLSEIQAYSQVIQRLAPQQRAPGSGSTSDIEFKGFLKSLPTLAQHPAAREVGLNTMEALTRDEIARGEIASRLASKEITRVQAEKELRALPDPMKAFTEWRKANPQLYGQALKGAAAPASAAPKFTTQEISQSIDNARKAITGDPSKRDAVLKKLRDNGITPPGDL